ncbi:11118_t:CDS:1, partial [Racocetra fulgida]
EMGPKQEIVSRLLRESHNQLGLKEPIEDVDVFGKGKEVQPQFKESSYDTFSELEI